MNNNPIGIFDSGVGGTSIWSQINELLPNENYIYLADSINAPYGNKSKEEIKQLCIKNVQLLLQMNCKLIVVACNTATTNAIKELRQEFNIPFIGIEPAIKPAAYHSKTNTIGILATKGTLNSSLFYNHSKNFKNTLIIEQIGYGLVELIENGDLYSEELISKLKSYLKPMIKQNIDCLVLGCSHYPYLTKQIKAILPSNVSIIDSGKAVAKQTKNILCANNIENISSHYGTTTFYTNKSLSTLSKLIDSSKHTIIEKEF